ncbi:MAG: signal peptidase I [Woeseiaceae bacterium]|nr:signal peptidase I [Woeseiaceae bacterium]
MSDQPDTLAASEQGEEQPARGGPAFLAFVGGFIVPGLGFMFCGRFRLAVLAAFVPFLILGVFGWSRIVLTPIGYLVTGGTAIAVLIGIASYAARLVWLTYEPGFIGRRWRSIVGLSVLLLVILNVIYEFRGLILGWETFRSPASSMADTLQEGDHFLADTWAYRNSVPSYGDIVVFTHPENGAKYVKRVVGLPGERFRVVDGIAVRDGVAMEEPWADFRNSPPRPYGTYLDVEIPEGYFYVMGDNRNNSMDSRIFGPIAAEALNGRVIHRFFPTQYVFPNLQETTVIE